jgi:hypothetical protein
VALPAGLVATTDEAFDVWLATLDASSLDAAAAELAAMNETRVAWIVPIAGSGARGAFSWMLARSKKLRPIALEAVCDVLRHAGVVDVRVVRMEGSSGLALVHGRLGASLDSPDGRR